MGLYEGFIGEMEKDAVTFGRAPGKMQMAARSRQLKRKLFGAPKEQHDRIVSRAGKKYWGARRSPEYQEHSGDIAYSTPAIGRGLNRRREYRDEAKTYPVGHQLRKGYMDLLRTATKHVKENIAARRSGKEGVKPYEKVMDTAQARRDFSVNKQRRAKVIKQLAMIGALGVAGAGGTGAALLLSRRSKDKE